MPRIGVAGLSTRDRAGSADHPHPARRPRRESARGGCAQLVVGIDLRRGLSADQTDVARPHEHVRIADVDERRVDGADARHVEAIDRTAGRQQRSGRRAGRIGQIDQDLRAGARNTRHRIVAALHRPAAGHRDFQREHAVEVGVVDADHRQRLGRFDEVLGDGKRADRRADVAAQAQVVDVRLVDGDLAERIGQVSRRRASVVRTRRADDRHLAGQRIGAAEPIDLASVRRPEDRQDGAQAGARLTRHIRFLEEHRLAGSPAHDDAANRGHVADVSGFG